MKLKNLAGLIASMWVLWVGIVVTILLFIVKLLYTIITQPELLHQWYQTVIGG